jgi:type I restriction enzyme S subunit
MEYALSELFTLQMGKTPSRDNSSYWKKSENNWISIADLTNSGKYISNTKETLSDSAVAESGIKKIPANTVIMSFKLSLGKVAITEKEMYSNEAIMAFIDKGVEKISPEYLYYLLRAKDWSKGTNKAVMGATLNKATLSTIKIQLHEYDNQLEIVNMLNRVSSSIDFRKQQLTKLDELIKARFVEMFGDLVENPKQFPCVLLGSIMTVMPQNGLYKPQSAYVQDKFGTPILRIDGFYNGKVTDFNNLKRLCCTDFEKERYLLVENDIVINRVNSIEYLGKCARISGLQEDTVFESNMMRFHLDDSKVNSTYITTVLCSQYIYRQILTRAKKAVNQASINQGDVQSLNVVVPPLSLQNQFAAFVAEVDKSKVEVQKALDQTQLLFDSLMQQYFG